MVTATQYFYMAAGKWRQKRAQFHSAAVASELYGQVVIRRVLHSSFLGFAEPTLQTKKEIAMIRVVNQLVGMVLVGAIAGSVALAKEIKKEVTFSQPIEVNGTLVKKGTYDAVFDDQTNELSIVKGRKVVARAPAQLEKRNERDRSVYVTREEEGDSTKVVLLSVTLKDGNRATIVSSGDSAQ
jgi:hypothetical protein